MPTSMQAGDVLAERYRLDDLLAENGAGRFWRAHDLVLHRAVAVHLLPADDDRAEPLLEAARGAGPVIDRRLLRVLDAEAADGRCYVVNEWGQGDSLDILLAREGPLPPRRAAWLVGEVADSMAEAHAAGLAHGRLIPENVLIDQHGQVRIIGFGVDAALRGLPPGPRSASTRSTSPACSTARSPASGPASPSPPCRPRPRCTARCCARAGCAPASRGCSTRSATRSSTPARAAARRTPRLTRRAASATCSTTSSATSTGTQVPVRRPAPAATPRPAPRRRRARAPTSRPRRPRRTRPPAPRRPSPTDAPEPDRPGDPRADPSRAAAAGPSTCPPRPACPSSTTTTRSTGCAARAERARSPRRRSRTPPPKPLFAPDPPDGEPVRRPRPGSRAAPATPTTGRGTPPRTRAQDSGVRPAGRDTGSWASGSWSGDRWGTVTARRHRRPGARPQLDPAGDDRGRLRAGDGGGGRGLPARAQRPLPTTRPTSRPPRPRPRPRPSRPPSPAWPPTTSTRRAPTRARRTPTRSPNVVDGDPATSWSTSTYEQNFGPGGLKTGVGLVVDLGATKGVRQVVVTTDGGETALAAYVTSDGADGRRRPDPRRHRVRHRRRSRSRSTRPSSGRYVTVWLTLLPAGRRRVPRHHRRGAGARMTPR